MIHLIKENNINMHIAANVMISTYCYYKATSPAGLK